MREISYSTLEKRFQSQAGLASLDSTDKFFFKNNLNSRAREAWGRADWPELISIASRALSDTAQGAKTTTANSFDVLDVYDKHPYTERNARKLNYLILEGRIVMNSNFPGDTIHILKKAEFVEYNEDSTNIPAFLENYLTSAILSDFFRGDGQHDVASREEARSENFLLLEIEKAEKHQNQNRITVTTYNNLNQQPIIYQTT